MTPYFSCLQMKHLNTWSIGLEGMEVQLFWTIKGILVYNGTIIIVGNVGIVLDKQGNIGIQGIIIVWGNGCGIVRDYQGNIRK